MKPHSRWITQWCVLFALGLASTLVSKRSWAPVVQYAKLGAISGSVFKVVLAAVPEMQRRGLALEAYSVRVFERETVFLVRFDRVAPLVSGCARGSARSAPRTPRGCPKSVTVFLGRENLGVRKVVVEVDSGRQLHAG